MVVRLSLYGSVPETELEITLHTLRALSGMKSINFKESVLVWEPKYAFKPRLAAGEINQIEQYRIFTKCPAMVIYDDDENLLNYEWTMEVQEVPEPGRDQKAIFQQILQSKVQQGNLFRALENLGYKYSKQFWLQGYEFVVGHVVLRLFRIHAPDPKQLVDSTGQFTLVAHVDVGKLTDRNAIEVATNELEGVQTDLKTLVSLELPSRNQFDTRVRR